MLTALIESPNGLQQPTKSARASTDESIRLTPVPNDWRRRIVEICRALEPAVARIPFYVLDQGEAAAAGFPEAETETPFWAGITSHVLSLECRGWLEQTGQWCGPGFAMVIRNDGSRDWFELLATGIHEFAHQLQFLADGLSYAGPGGAATRISLDHTPRADEDLRESHGLGFIQACAHLSHRLQDLPRGLLGLDATDAAVLGSFIAPGPRLGLRSLCTYKRALGQELHQTDVCVVEHIQGRGTEDFRALFEPEPELPADELQAAGIEI